MPIQDILEFIDQEISRLQSARTLLGGVSVAEVPGKRRGRPKSSTTKPPARSAPVAKEAKRTMSPEGKARIAAAQKARWTKDKKAAVVSKKTATTSSSTALTRTSKPAGNKASAKKTPSAKKKAARNKSAFIGQPPSSSSDAAEA